LGLSRWDQIRETGLPQYRRKLFRRRILQTCYWDRSKNWLMIARATVTKLMHSVPRRSVVVIIFVVIIFVVIIFVVIVATAERRGTLR
jgi:hypothetical protein